MSKTKAEADDAPVPTHSNETKPEMSAHENVDNGNGSVTQDHKQIRTEEEAIAQNHIAALQTHEAEIRRQEEETALIQAGFMINQKIRACRQQIFSAMQRLQSLKEEQTKIENILLSQANSFRETSKGTCSPVRLRLGISSSHRRRRDLLQRIDEIRVTRIEVERSLEEAQKTASAAVREEHRIEFLLNANVQRKVLLQRLSSLRENSQLNEDSSNASSTELSKISSNQNNDPNQTGKHQIPVVLRVKSMGHDSECNPPMEEEGNITTLTDMNQDQHDADQCSTSKPPGVSSTVPSFHAGTEASKFEASSCSYEKYEYHQVEYRIACGDRPLLLSTDERQGLSCTQSNRSFGAKWVTPTAEDDIDADELISCQLSTDYSVDFMSTLSVTEGPVSLTSSVTSTASSCYTPRRQRILGQASSEATSRSRKLHSADGNMRGKDRMRYSSAGNTTGLASVFQKADKNVGEVGRPELCSKSYNSDREVVGFGFNSIAEVSRHNGSHHSDDGIQIYQKAADLPMVISESEEVQLLYERAMAAEYENKQLRNRIEALELECDLLRSSSNISGKEILGVLSHLDDGNESAKSLFALKCSNDLQAMRFSRSPYAQESSASFGDDMALQPRYLFDPFQPLCYDTFRDGVQLPFGSADEEGGSGSATRTSEQQVPTFSRSGYARLSSGFSWLSMTEGESGEPGPGPPALFFKRMSNITATYALHDARDSRSEERYFPGFANPRSVPPRSPVSFATLEQRQADLAAQHRVDGLEEAEEGSESLCSVIGPKEQFFISPNALEASLYNVRGDSAFCMHDGIGAWQESGGAREGAPGADRAGAHGWRIEASEPWKLEGRGEAGGAQDPQGRVDPSFFMVV